MIQTKDGAKLYIVLTNAVVYNDKGEFLVQRRSANELHAAGTIAYPGGKIEVEGISEEGLLEKNVIKEVKEETDIEIEKPEYFLSNSFLRSDGNTVVSIVFLAKYKSGEAKVADPDEVDEVMWMKFEDIKEEDSVVHWIFKRAWNFLKEQGRF